MNFTDTLARRDPRDPCPTCETVGGYCGGENHPSCGLFENGRPVAAQKEGEQTMQKTIVKMWLAEESIDAIKAATLLSESEVWRVLGQYISTNFWGFNEG